MGPLEAGTEILWMIEECLAFQILIVLSELMEARISLLAGFQQRPSTDAPCPLSSWEKDAVPEDSLNVHILIVWSLDPDANRRPSRFHPTHRTVDRCPFSSLACLPSNMSVDVYKGVHLRNGTNYIRLN